MQAPLDMFTPLEVMCCVPGLSLQGWLIARIRFRSPGERYCAQNYSACNKKIKG
jgi:hypothetical protein